MIELRQNLEQSLAVLREFGCDPLDLADEVIRLRALLDKTQKDLDHAVGYRLEAAMIPKGEWCD